MTEALPPTIVKARAYHKCFACGITIRPGMRYSRHVSFAEGTADTVKLHLLCAAWWLHYADYDGCADDEHFREWLGDLTLPELDALIAAATDEQRLIVASEIRQQWAELHATPEVFEELERLRARVAELERTFLHSHHAGKGGDIDTCAKCGLDIRDSIHKRGVTP